MRHIQHITAGLLALLLAACSNDPRTGRDTQYLGRAGQAVTRNGPAYDTVSYWDGDAAHGAPSIVIDLGEQKAFYYKGGELVGVSVISTGREGYGTPTGHFHIIQKDKDHKSTLYGDYVDAQGNVLKKDIDIHKDPKPPGAIFDGAKMPFFLRIVGGTGMHAGFLPGYPASHGCIRMPAFMAEAFFKNTPTGTPVEIRN